MSTCTFCAEPIAPGDQFCEACGRRLDPTPAGPDASTVPDTSTGPDTSVGSDGPGSDGPGSDGSGSDGSGSGGSGSDGSTGPDGVFGPPDEGGAAGRPRADRCRRCPDGTVTDGYCDTCGMAPEPENAHQYTDLTSWLGGCCDIGRRRTSNQDALAVGRTGEHGDTGVLVVCDGVTSAPDSDRAAQAAAAAALAALLEAPDELADAVAAAGEAAAAAAQDDEEEDRPSNAPACTLALGVLRPGPDGTATISTAGVGDSRCYWLPDDPSLPALQLGMDDSVAAQLIEAGMSAREAESGPGAHAITAWLGRDAPPLTPNLDGWETTGPGWLLVCSDGLWNYFSSAEQLRELVQAAHDELADATTPVHLAEAGPVQVRAMHVAQQLVARANDAGGRDNISVALARWTPPTADSTDMAVSSDSEGSR